MSIPELSHEVRQQIVEFCTVGEGWLTPERGIEMAELVMAIQPRTVVEIGTFGGRSLISQALALKQLGKGRIYGIDSWKHADTIEGETDASAKDWWSNNVDLHAIHKLCVEAIWKFGLDAHAVLVRTQSQHCVDLFTCGIDILFIDGNHSELASCRDVVNYLPLVNANGYIWMDDADWETTQKAVSMVAEKCQLIRDHSHWKLFCNLPPKH